MTALARGVILAVLGFSSACASLGSLSRLIQPPRFSEAEDQPAEIRLVGPAADRPLGCAVVRIWTRVSNPNPFGLRLSTLETTLLLDGSRAATGDFPLGLPLRAGEESVIPLDLLISFSDMAGLSSVVRNAIGGERVGYQLDGTIGIDAGALGQPTFGPVMLFRGELGAGRDSRSSLDRSGRVLSPTGRRDDALTAHRLGYWRVRTGLTMAIGPTSLFGSALGFGRNFCDRSFATSVT